MKLICSLLAAAFLSAASMTQAADMDILSGTMPVAGGGCYFKDGKFLLFAAGTYMAPQGVVERARCVVFAKSRDEINPVWLVLFDKKGEPQKIIRWTDPANPVAPAEFEVVWANGIEM